MTQTKIVELQNKRKAANIRKAIGERDHIIGKFARCLSQEDSTQTRYRELTLLLDKDIKREHNVIPRYITTTRLPNNTALFVEVPESWHPFTALGIDLLIAVNNPEHLRLEGNRIYQVSPRRIILHLSSMLDHINRTKTCTKYRSLFDGVQVRDSEYLIEPFSIDETDIVYCDPEIAKTLPQVLQDRIMRKSIRFQIG